MFVASFRASGQRSTFHLRSFLLALNLSEPCYGGDRSVQTPVLLGDAGVRALTTLDLSRNCLASMQPNALAGCSSLVSLSLSNNRLKV